MTLTIGPESFFVFDLDDTLYKEIDFVRSAYREIANRIYEEISIDTYDDMLFFYQQGIPAFTKILGRYSSKYTVEDLIEQYKSHLPNIECTEGVIDLLTTLKSRNIRMGLLTDGRTRTQRNKLRALELERFFIYTVISEDVGSEKPASVNYELFENRFPNSRFIYLADNIAKDFYSANKLGWTTIQLKDDGSNIHSQEIKVAKGYKPSFTINSFLDLKIDFDV